MTLHREGLPALLISAVLFPILVWILVYFTPGISWLHYTFGGLLGLVYFWFLWFFRIPARKINVRDNAILAPADGKVVVIEKAFEQEFLKEDRIQISIFMSPLNVHRNLTPVSGSIKYTCYHPGKYLVAWHPKSSTENERNTVVMERKDGLQVLFRQIAGAMARRIKCYAKPEEQYEQGQEFGFIKFGSRVDTFIPLDARIKVSEGDIVKCGQTVLAEV